MLYKTPWILNYDCKQKEDLNIYLNTENQSIKQIFSRVIDLCSLFIVGVGKNTYKLLIKYKL